MTSDKMLFGGLSVFSFLVRNEYSLGISEAIHNNKTEICFAILKKKIMPIIFIVFITIVIISFYYLRLLLWFQTFINQQLLFIYWCFFIYDFIIIIVLCTNYVKKRYAEKHIILHSVVHLLRKYILWVTTDQHKWHRLTSEITQFIMIASLNDKRSFGWHFL